MSTVRDDTDTDDDESPSLPPMRPTRVPLLRARGRAGRQEGRLRALRELGALPAARPDVSHRVD